MLEKCKNALRITDNDFDNDILDLIEAARTDLKTSGIASTLFYNSEENHLLNLAIINYVKANFGYDNPESEKFMKSYETIKIKLSIIFPETGDSK